MLLFLYFNINFLCEKTNLLIPALFLTFQNFVSLSQIKQQSNGSCICMHVWGLLLNSFAQLENTRKKEYQ